MFAAVVVGGTRLGGGRGGPIGSIFGAYILMIVVNILLVLNVSAYYSTIAESVILLLAVLAASIARDSPLAIQLRGAATRVAAWRAGTLPVADRRRRPTAVDGAGMVSPAVRSSAMPSFWTRHAETLRYALPAYVALRARRDRHPVHAGQHHRCNWAYWNSLIVLASFLAVLALGQGTVILTGGLDLSVPWTIGFSGILLAGIVQGSDAALIYALPIVLGIAVVIGLVNGVGIVVLGLSPIVVTLAMNGVLQGAALLYSQRHAGRLLLAAPALVHDRAAGWG